MPSPARKTSAPPESTLASHSVYQSSSEQHEQSRPSPAPEGQKLDVGSSCSERLRIAILWLLSRYCPGLLPRPWVIELAREWSTCLSRTRTLLSQRRVVFLDMGPCYGVHSLDGYLVKCSRTLGRKMDMQIFHDLHPQATADYLKAFLAGWNMGSEWAYGNPHLCKADSEGRHCPSLDFRWEGAFVAPRRQRELYPRKQRPTDVRRSIQNGTSSVINIG
jgi:hypothetical protein